MIFQKRTFSIVKTSLLTALACSAVALQAQRCGYDYIVAVVVKVVDGQGNKNISDLKLSFVSPNSKELTYQDFIQPQVYVSEDMGTPIHRIIPKSAEYDKPMLFWQNKNAERNYPALGKPSKLNLKEDAYVLFLDVRNLQNDQGMGKIPKMVKLRVAIPNKKNKKIIDSIIEIPFDLNYHVALCGSRLVEKEYQTNTATTQGYQEKYHNGEPFAPLEIDISNPNFSRYSPKSNLVFLQPVVHAKSDYPRADSLYAIKAIAVYSASNYKLIQKIDIPNPLYLSKNHGKAIEIMDFYGDNPAKILDFRVLIAEKKDNLGEGYRKHLHFTYDTLGKVFKSDTFLNAYSNIELNPEAKSIVRWEYEDKPTQLLIQQYILTNKKWVKVNTFPRNKAVVAAAPNQVHQVVCISNNNRTKQVPWYVSRKSQILDTFIFVNSSNKKLEFEQIASNELSAFTFPKKVDHGDTFRVYYNYSPKYSVPYLEPISHYLKVTTPDGITWDVETMYYILTGQPQSIDTLSEDTIQYRFLVDTTQDSKLYFEVSRNQQGQLIARGLVSRLKEDNYLPKHQGKWFVYQSKFNIEYPSWRLSMEVLDEQQNIVHNYTLFARKNGKWEAITYFNKGGREYCFIPKTTDSVKVVSGNLTGYYKPIFSEYVELLSYSFQLISPGQKVIITKYNGVKMVKPYTYINGSYMVFYNWVKLRDFYKQQHPKSKYQTQVIPSDTLAVFARKYLVKRFPGLFENPQVQIVSRYHTIDAPVLKAVSPKERALLIKVSELDWVTHVSQVVQVSLSSDVVFETAFTGEFNAKLQQTMGYDSLKRLMQEIPCKHINTQPEGTYVLELSQKIIEKRDIEQLFQWLDKPQVYNCGASLYSPFRPEPEHGFKDDRVKRFPRE